MVVDDNEALRTLMIAALEGRGYEPRGAGNGVDALRLLREWDPDAAILDVDLGVRPNGVELAGALLGRAPFLAVVFLTSFAHPPGFDALAERHAIGFLLKSELTSMDRLDEMLDAALRGAAVPTEPVATRSLSHRLTATQLEVLRLVAAGWSNQRIAESRSSTVRSVERLLDRIYALLDMEPTSAATARVLAAQAYAREFGFVEADADAVTGR